MIELILSQGRIADRKNGTIEGALLTAKAIEQTYGVTAMSHGIPAPAKIDDWTDSLAQADATLRGLSETVESGLKDGKLPVMVANTCSASLATLPIVARELPDAVVLWIDAHGDFNTPDTTDSGYLGGMVVAAACGLWDSGHGSGLKAEQVLIVGGRDIDPQEARLLDEHRVRVLPPQPYLMDKVISNVGNRPVWIHIDWDVLEPGYIPADYTVPGGLLPDDIRLLLSRLAPQIRGLEIAEYHAGNDTSGKRDPVVEILKTISPVLGQQTIG